MFIHEKKSAFGLDLSDLSVKIAVLELAREGRVSLASFGREEIEAGVIEGGQIKKEEELITILKNAASRVKGEKIKTKYCVVSLPETESYIRVLKLPVLSSKEMGEAIKWEIEANMPVAIDEVYFDWQLISDEKSSGSNVLVGALPKALVDPYLGVLKKAGFLPLAFEIESLATARALIKKDAWSQPLMIVDFGAKRTSLIVFAGNSVWFTCSLAISNSVLIQEIANSLKIDFEKAKKLKFEKGMEKTEENKEVYAVLEPRLLELVGEIKRYIDYCQSRLLPKYFSEVQKIIVCGGGANLKGVCEFLSGQLKIGVELGNPWINILNSENKESPALPFEDSLSFTTSLGLALGGINLF
ncbi:MAG: type IV pilus assembly protein PilM [Candidatus Portnoybacteria bacterium]|nr:type IV pilus assembly protein PilM [Candidatus Portnoybacteria bacterium]